MNSNSLSDNNEIIKEEVIIRTKLGPCEVCNKNPAKYTCPKCEVKTCCLNCNKIHKSELECDGQRNPTKFIPLQNFTNLDLLSDYRFLEETSKVVERAKKGSNKKPKRELPYRQARLKIEASKRKITVNFLPIDFQRHKENRSKYYFIQDLIAWHIDLVFINANFTISEDLVFENKKISSILDKYFNGDENKEIQEKLQYYRAVGLSGVRLFLKADLKEKNKFYDLDPTLTLLECLRNKGIIEFPVIHVVLKDHSTLYDVIDSDEEVEVKNEENLKNGNDVINKIVQNAEKEDKMNNPLKNLLFLNSDDEISDEPDQ